MRNYWNIFNGLTHLRINCLVFFSLLTTKWKISATFSSPKIPETAKKQRIFCAIIERTEYSVCLLLEYILFDAFRCHSVVSLFIQRNYMWFVFCFSLLDTQNEYLFSDLIFYGFCGFLCPEHRITEYSLCVYSYSGLIFRVFYLFYMLIIAQQIRRISVCRIDCKFVTTCVWL